jgi:hypothetical protein
MKTATQLRNDLATVFDELRTGQIEVKHAAELNNTAGKMIATAKAQLEYYALTGEKPSIPFLKEDEACSPT